MSSSSDEPEPAAESRVVHASYAYAFPAPLTSPRRSTRFIVIRIDDHYHVFVRVLMLASRFCAFVSRPELMRAFLDTAVAAVSGKCDEVEDESDTMTGVDSYVCDDYDEDYDSDEMPTSDALDILRRVSRCLKDQPASITTEVNEKKCSSSPLPASALIDQIIRDVRGRVCGLSVRDSPNFLMTSAGKQKSIQNEKEDATLTDNNSVHLLTKDDIYHSSRWKKIDIDNDDSDEARAALDARVGRLIFAVAKRKIKSHETYAALLRKSAQGRYFIEPLSADIAVTELGQFLARYRIVSDVKPSHPEGDGADFSVVVCPSGADSYAPPPPRFKKRSGGGNKKKKERNVRPKQGAADYVPTDNDDHDDFPPVVISEDDDHHNPAHKTRRVDKKDDSDSDEEFFRSLTTKHKKTTKKK